MKRIILGIVAMSVAAFSSAGAVVVNWTDWQSAGTGGTTALGVIDVGGTTVTVSLSGPVLGFLQTGGGTDFWQNGSAGRNPASSAYTSTGPDGNSNIPTGTDIVAMSRAGTYTLAFSQPVDGLYYSYVSMNGNAYTFDRSFEHLSNTRSNIDGAGIDDSGYWGAGTVSVAGNTLAATGGEPHGTLFFGGQISQLVWTVGQNEFWNGFTIGVGDVGQQVPLPAGVWLFGSGLAALAAARRRRVR